MKKILLLSIIFVFVLISKGFAEDTTTVQVLTFDYIPGPETKGITVPNDTIAHFPTEEKSYRKILMYYRLKCDPATTRDGFNCGEWDYGTYTKLFFPTGQKDSTAKTYYPYKIKNTSPDTILLGGYGGQTIYQHNEITRTNTGGSDETLLEFNGEETGVIDLDSNIFRIQFTMTKAEIKEQGGNSAKLNDLRLFANSAGKVRNFTIRLNVGSSELEDGFLYENMDIVFQRREFEFVEGENIITFNEEKSWSRFKNVTIEISGEKLGVEPLPKFDGFVDSRGYIAYGEMGDFSLYFDGGNDYVECGIFDLLTEASQCTFEAWVKVDEWKNWASILTLGGKAGIQLGDNEEQLYAIMRSWKDSTSYNNSHGNEANVLPLDTWTHVALVFDGTASTNESKLKLFINGEAVELDFSETIPNTTYVTPQDFRIGSAGFKGSIDEVRIFNTAVDAETIKMMKDQSKDAFLAEHPNKENLIAYFNMDATSDTGLIVENHVEASTNHGSFIGCPEFVPTPAYNYLVGVEELDLLPKMTLQTGEYTFETSVEVYDEVVLEQIATLHTFYEEDDVVKEDEDAVRFVSLAGWFYTNNPDGEKIDSTYIEPTETIINAKQTYYLDPYDVNDVWEIARYITPYGINFSLGSEGFLWVYDVTDYAPFLKGDVRIQAHNNQELIDLKFLFIEGTPPRDVVSIDRVWEPLRSYKYSAMDNNTVMYDTLHTLKPETKQAKIITRITGHGHSSSNGKSPWCCEWKTNEHTLLINQGEKELNWYIWRDDCGENPIGNQGGTWPGSREGWCPGDLVRNTEFELTDYITEDNTISIDYEITPVPENNLGMGNGYYLTSMQLIQYGESNFETDAELCLIASPNEWRTYMNRSLICNASQVIVRNNGKNPITSMKFEYYVKGAEVHTQTYDWEGSIAVNRKDTIDLPIPWQPFWFGDTELIFNVEILEVNGGKDDQAINDKASTHFEMPEMYEDKIYFELTTNKRGSDFEYTVYDIGGNEVFYRQSLSSSQTYRDTINVSNCYMMELNDRGRSGLSYWAYSAQGEGSMRIKNLNGQTLKIFDPDCGAGYQFPFNLGSAGYVNEPNFDKYFSIYPTPCENTLYLEAKELFGNIDINIYDLSGKVVFSQKTAFSKGQEMQFDVSKLTTGFYYIIIGNEEQSFKQKFIKK